MKWLCLLAVLAAALCTSSAKRSFVLTGPKLYDVGESETLVLHLFDVKESGFVNIRLVNSTGDDVYSELAVPIENGESKSVQFPVPELPKNVFKAKLVADGLIGDYRINKSVEVGFRIKTPIVFVNTDKPIYKAGQTVNVRVLITDTELRPHKEAKVGHIWISDPNRVRVAQWTNESLGGGLVHKKFPLPEEPVLGQWLVEVKINDRTSTRFFEVKEYVLPVFEVKITPPPYILITAKNSTWEVCAKYTYGKPVKGMLFTKIFQSPYYWEKEHKYIENRTEIIGCTKVTLPVEELRNRAGYYPYRTLELYAEVTEEGTGTKMNSTATIVPISNAYTISRIDGLHPTYFRPGIPLKMAMAVKTPDSKPLPDELINVCIEVVKKKWSNIPIHTVTDTSKLCKNYTSDNDGKIHFTIPPQDPSTVSVRIDLEAAVWKPEEIEGYSLHKPGDFFTLLPWFSASGSQIQLSRISKIDCTAFGSDVKVTLPFHISYSESGIKKMYYQIMSRGDIVRHADFDLNLEPNNKNMTDDTYLPDFHAAMHTESGFQWENQVNPAKYINQNYLSFKLDDKMIPKIRILLFTVREDGDVVADSVSYDTDPCFANQVEMKFGEEKQFPGDKATIHLKAEPQSLCSVGIVDKSVYILQKADLLSGSQINSNLLPLDTTSYTYPDQRTPDYTYCSKKLTAPSGYRRPFEPAGYLDAISAFADNGGVVLSDLELETRPCQPQTSGGCNIRPPIVYESHNRVGYGGAAALSFDSAPVGAPGSAGLPGPPPPQPPAVTVRTDFPDTWLFELFKVSDGGSLEVKQKMPDSITEWQGQAICIHPDKGLGLSKPASIVAFQPFFASLRLPYSVIRKETVPIIVTVFNYLKDCLPIKVNLHQSDHFSLYNGTLTRSVCVCGEESSTIYFHVTPTKLGVMNVTATAETTEDKELCGNLDAALDVKRSDTLTKPLLVEAEGFMKEDVFNSYFCIEEEDGGIFKAEHLLKLPEATTLVPDSARAYTSVTGDLMGPTLDGLERLVRMPTGCGEQNMISLVPNIVVGDYLNATNKLTEELSRKIVDHIYQGYVRQQKYLHPDGSYSAFGKSDKEGSMWLTAFVVRTFASSRRYINIDDRILNNSREWILRRQRENGCFPMVGTVHNKAMKGGVSKENETTSTLTAYVLTSLLESGIVKEEVVTKAFSCIEAKNKPSNYSMSLFAYAATLAKHQSASEYLERLMSNAEKDGGFLYWKDSDKSIAVETASYVTLTLLESGSREDFVKAASIARWLAKQRNSYGGFYSTQDTVMALQALGKYGSIVTRTPPQMEVSVKTDKVDAKFQVNPENQLLMQRTNLKLEELPETKVEIVASGSGCALAQTSLRYNIFVPPESEDFSLDVKTQRKSGDCSDIEIQVCASYNHPDGSNMAIIEIKMVTGYSPVIDTVKKLLQLNDLEIKRYEFQENTNTLFLYIQTLTDNKRCFSFDVTQDIKVLDVKPSSAKVYDYYDEGKSVSVPYSIEETCRE